MSVYVGIPNEGAFCYLISVVQQLYFMHDFRAIIMTTDSENEKSQALILHVRSLFTALDNRADADQLDVYPIFEHLYKDLPGGIYTQKDASEFLSDLVRSLGLDAQLKDLLTGQLVNVLSTSDDGNGVPRSFERPEKFLFSSVTVSCPDGVNNLQNSLLEFTKTETIKYRWSALPTTPTNTNLVSNTTASSSAGNNTSLPLPPICAPLLPPTPPVQLPNVPVPTQMKTLYKALPKYLTFHLKRFWFNVATMKKEKLHHRFEFPELLDMSPYVVQGTRTTGSGDGTAGGSADINNTGGVTSGVSRMYKLSGVVVHKGRSTYRGHYYSFIRERSNTGTTVDDLATAINGVAMTDTGTNMPAVDTATVADTTGTVTADASMVMLTNYSGTTTTAITDKWFLFDDYDVMPFHPVNIAKQCFGGPRDRSVSSDSESSGSDRDSSDSDDESGDNSSEESDVESGSDERESESEAEKGDGSVCNDALSVHSEDSTHNEAIETAGDAANCAEACDTHSLNSHRSHHSARSHASDHSVRSHHSSSTNSNTNDSSASSDADSSSDYSDSDSDSETREKPRVNYKSAFMLFYERID